jgi:AhpD family alkylhydroperoxidase
MNLTGVAMEARMTHPVYVAPAALEALHAYSRAGDELGVSREVRELVNLRASQINGCSVCVELHSAALKKEGCSDERLYAVAAWRDAPYFTDAERAALELAEAMTRVADRGDPVSDELWAELTRHYDERGITALMIAITGVNVWNRLNAATRQPAGAWRP